jgi:hypothetical protein
MAHAKGRLDEAIVKNTKGAWPLLNFKIADQLWKNHPNAKGVPGGINGGGIVNGGAVHHETARELDESVVSARRREAVAIADLKEHQRDVQIGKYWPRSEMIKHATMHAQMVSAAREAIPSQLAPFLVGRTDVSEIERLLREALRDADLRVANELESRFGKLESLEVKMGSDQTIVDETELDDPNVLAVDPEEDEDDDEDEDDEDDDAEAPGAGE